MNPEILLARLTRIEFLVRELTADRDRWKAMYETLAESNRRFIDAANKGETPDEPVQAS